VGCSGGIMRILAPALSPTFLETSPVGILAALLLLSLALAGCAGTPAGARVSARHQQPALTPAAFTLPPTPGALRLLDEESARPKRQVDLAQVWILGKWKTFEHRSGSVEGVAQFEFRQEGTELKWRMVRRGWLSGVQTTQVASGTVESLSEGSVELRGTYEYSNLGNVVGTSLQHSLSHHGHDLRGFEAASDGRQSLLSLKRVQ
jgi:hypothetical protein